MNGFLARARLLVLVFPLYGLSSSFVQGCAGLVRQDNEGPYPGYDCKEDEDPVNGDRCDSGGYGYGYDYGAGAGCDRPCH